MKCSFCGNNIDDNFKFCPLCGANLKESNVEDEEFTAGLIKTMIDTEGKQTEIKPEQSGEDKINDIMVDSGFRPKKSGGFSIAGFVLALCSMFVSYLAFPCAVVGLIFSCVGLSRCAKGTGSKHGLAVAGLVISIISLSLMLISTVYCALSYHIYSISSPFMNWV